MSSSSQEVTRRPDASAGLSSGRQPESVAAANTSDPIHDLPSHDDDLIWPSIVPTYRQERVQLVPHSPNSGQSSSSRSTASRRRTPKKSKSKSRDFGHSQMLEPYRKELEAPSFRSIDLRPSALRTTSSPAMLPARPLSLSELIQVSGRDSDDVHSHESDNKTRSPHPEREQEARYSEQKVYSREYVDPPDEHLSQTHPDLLAARSRGRCYSSPSAVEYPQLPLSSFTDMWR